MRTQQEVLELLERADATLIQRAAEMSGGNAQQIKLAAERVITLQYIEEVIMYILGEWEMPDFLSMHS